MSDSYGDLWILGSVVLIGLLVRVGLGVVARVPRAARAEDDAFLLRGRHAARDRDDAEEDPVPESGIRLKVSARNSPEVTPERSA
jgi:hypothetical protein